MSAIAHIGGLPLEELLVPALAGASGGLLLARGWISSRLRHREESPE